MITNKLGQWIKRVEKASAKVNQLMTRCTSNQSECVCVSVKPNKYESRHWMQIFMKKRLMVKLEQRGEKKCSIANKLKRSKRSQNGELIASIRAVEHFSFERSIWTFGPCTQRTKRGSEICQVKHWTSQNGKANETIDGDQTWFDRQCSNSGWRLIELLCAGRLFRCIETAKCGNEWWKENMNKTNERRRKERRCKTNRVPKNKDRCGVRNKLPYESGWNGCVANLRIWWLVRRKTNSNQNWKDSNVDQTESTRIELRLKSTVARPKRGIEKRKYEHDRRFELKKRVCSN